MVAFIGVLTLIVTLIIGIPLPFAFACAFMWLTVGYGYTPDFLLAAGYGQLNSVVLLAIPLFILAGGIMEKGKIGGALIGFVQIFLGDCEKKSVNLINREVAFYGKIKLS